MNQKRLLTWILLGVGGACVIFAGLLAYVAMTFDINDYKGRLSRQVAERYQRTLVIDGDLSLSFFPSVAIALPHTSLSEPGKNEIAAEVKEARVALALMPLVRKEIQVGQIVLDGLKAVVTKDKAGKSNFDDLLGVSTKAEPPQKPAVPSAPPSLLNFDIDGLRIINSAFTYRNLATGKDMALTEVNLNAGRLAALSATPLELSLHCESTDPAIKANVSMHGEIILDMTTQHYVADTLTLAFDGTVNEAPLSTQIDVSGLDWTASFFKAQSMKAVTKRGGTDSAEITLALANAHGSPSAVDGEQFTVAVAAKTGATGRTVAIDLKSPLTANLDLQTINIKALDGRINIEDPAAAVKVMKIALTGALDANAKEQKIEGKLTVAMDESKIDARVDVAGFTKPAIGFDLDIDTINVDRYIEQETAAATAKDDAAQPGPGKDAQIDLSGLKGVSVDGSARIGALQVHGIKSRDIMLKVNLNNGELRIAPLTANLYDGALDATASVNANTNHFSFAPKLTAIEAGPLLRDAAKLDKLEGKGDVMLDVTAQGNTVSALKQSLAGKGSVRLADGEIKGFDYGKRLAGWKEKLTNLGSAAAANEGVASSEEEKTAFSELSATFVVDKGVAANNDLSVKAPLVRLGGEGSIDIGLDSLDYTVKASVVTTLTGQGGKDIDQTKGLTIPVRAHGPFDKISYDIQWSELSSVALQSMVAPKIEEQKKVLQEKAGEKIKGSLQGLFK